MKFKVCKSLDYVQGHLRSGHGAVIVEAESKEEALKLAEKDFEDDNYEVEVEDIDFEEEKENDK